MLEMLGIFIVKIVIFILGFIPGVGVFPWILLFAPDTKGTWNLYEVVAAMCLHLIAWVAGGWIVSRLMGIY